MDRSKFNAIISFVTLFITCFFILLQSPLAPNANGFPGVDSSVFIHSAKQILEGKLIYKDVFDHKGPIIYLINVIGLSVGGNLKFMGIWILELLSLMFSAFIMYRTLRLFYGKLVSLLSVISSLFFMTPFLAGGNFTEEWAIPFISLALYIFAHYFQVKNEFKCIHLFLLSFSFVIALLLKTNLVVVWGVFGIIVTYDLLKTHRIKELTKYAGYILLFILITLAPFVFYFWHNGTLSDAYFCSFKYNIERYGSINYSTFYFLAKNLLGFGFLSILILLYLLYLLIEIIDNAFSKKQVLSDQLFNIGILVSVLFTILACSLGDKYIHYFLMAVPLIIFPYSFWLNFVYKVPHSTKSVIFLFWVFFIVNLKPVYVQWFNIKSAYNNDIGIGEAPSRKLIDSICFVISSNVSPKDEILVKGNQSSLYFLSNRHCSSRYPFRTYFTTEMEKEYLDYLITRRPKMVIAGPAVNDRYHNAILESAILKNYYFVEYNIEGVAFWILRE